MATVIIVLVFFSLAVACLGQTLAPTNYVKKDDQSLTPAEKAIQPPPPETEYHCSHGGVPVIIHNWKDQQVLSGLSTDNKNGVQIVHETYKPGRVQQEWCMEPNHQGFLWFVNRAHSRVLDVNDFGTTDGSSVHLWALTGKQNQQWFLDPLSSRPQRDVHRIVGRQSLKALEIKANKNDDMQIWSAGDDRDRQLWWFRRAFEETDTVCEHDTVTLTCAGGTIHIIAVRYGRTNNKICTGGPTTDVTCDGNSGTDTTIVSSKCNGKKTCSVQSSNAVFTDPCYGTLKYLTIQYACQ